MKWLIGLIIVCFIVGLIVSIVEAMNEGVTEDKETGIRYPNTKLTQEDVELYNRFGLTYIKQCKQEMLAAQKSANYYKQHYEYIIKNHDAALLLLEEYFAQDQTNDDLLVMALEAIQRCASANLHDYTDEDVADAIKMGLNKMQWVLQRRKSKNEQNRNKES